ncbi:MAG: ribonuclease Z, partial [bacterium]|nr:ribonuclease Z [bacterium]
NLMSAGMQSIEGAQPAKISDYYEIMPITSESTFSWQKINFKMIQTIHAYNGKDLVPSYGIYFVTPANIKVFITTDTQFKPQLYMSYFEQADIIFHDCDTSHHKNPVHAHFTELATLPADIKAKMWLYHYTKALPKEAKAEGFQGFVVKGQTFDI